LGGIISYFLNPVHGTYGNNVFPAMLAAQFIAVSVGIYIYFDGWVKNEWYPTFVAAYSVAPAVVLMYNGSPQSVVVGGILSALVCAPVSHMVIRNLPNGWNGVIANTFSMAVNTLVVAIVLKVLPGFGMPWPW
jgi:hypothetical protein